MAYKEYLRESGDGVNIIPFERVSKHSSGQDSAYVFEIPPTDNLSVHFEDAKDHKEDFSQEVLDKYPIIINVAFAVNGKVTKGKKSDLTTFHRIMKTVQECALDYLKDHDPNLIIVSSELPEEDGLSAGDDARRKREEVIKLDSYKASIMHLAEMLKSKGYSYKIGPIGPFKRNVMYMYKEKKNA